MMNIGIYVHVPFCKQKCLYCDFCSFCCEEKDISNYFDKLNEEIVNNSVNFKNRFVSTIYFGGGTPSSVDEQYICNTLNNIKKSFSVLDNAEITIECNPCSATEKKLLRYKECGFNRISFGVQSFDDKVLKAIGRLHTSKEAVEAIEMAKKVGFKNISCDLMIGLPYQTIEMLIDDARRLAELNVNHISCYMLQLEENTPLASKVQKGEISVADEDLQVEMYEKLVKELSNLGYEQYEVSNFAKNRTYSQHNLNYWRRGEYLGFGASAHSFIDENRFANASSFNDYYNNKRVFEEKLSEKEICEEKIMLGLRCFEGVDKKLLQDKPNIKEYLNKNILIEKDDKYILNPKFYSINNEIISSLF